MKKTILTVIAMFLFISFKTAAGVDMANPQTLFDDKALGFEGKAKLSCQARGDEISNTISEIIDAASADQPFSLLTSSLKFVHIGSSFIDECGHYMKPEEKEVLTALVNFANSFVSDDYDS